MRRFLIILSVAVVAVLVVVNCSFEDKKSTSGITPEIKKYVANHGANEEHLVRASEVQDPEEPEFGSKAVQVEAPQIAKLPQANPNGLNGERGAPDVR